MRILVVDDDEILVEIVKDSLEQQRHIVDIAEDGLIAWDYVESGEYELVILDINLPELDGVSLCKKIRSQGYTIPILLMTAKNATQDRILGLDAGADDYLTKPLNLDELNARVRALSRRGAVIPSTVLDVGGLTLDPSSCEVSYQQQPIKLTAKEYSLLELFLRNPARVFSRSQILDKIWTFDDPPLEESVKAHIKGLRKKLKQAGIVDWIENVYGMGYRLNPKVKEYSPKQQDASPSVVNTVAEEFEQKMAQIWLKYQPKMAERLNVLKNAAINLQQDQLSTEMHYAAERAAHKLAGVLGMLSRDQGTEIAREIETLLQDNQVLNHRQQEQFITLVTDLESLLGLDQTLTIESFETNSKLLLISEDTELSRELQQLSRTKGWAWHQTNHLTSARKWLKANSPYVVVVDTAIASEPQEYLALIAELNARTPAVATMLLAISDRLTERVTAVRAGVSSFLVKPVTATIIWQTVNQLLETKQSASTSILIVDDDLIFLSVIRSLLEPWGIRVHTLADPLGFWAMLQAISPDLLILDIEMPDINGIELCQALRSDPSWQDIPILFLTARQDAKTIEQVFTVGGDDYIAKPVVGAELIARINNRLERSRLLHHLATQDRLTGLDNRIHSSSKIEILLQQAQNLSQPLSLVVLKITELEAINLRYGHVTGDRILAQWGQIIQAACRNQEVTGYWGNGDFIIALTNLDKIQAQEHLTELLNILRKQIYNSPTGERFQVTFSYAVAEFPRDGKNLSSLYRAYAKMK